MPPKAAESESPPDDDIVMSVTGLDDTKSNNNNHNENSSKTNNDQSTISMEVDGKQEKTGKKKKDKAPKKKKGEQPALTDPDQIVRSVLEKSTFKVPNLSQIVSEKFAAPDYQSELFRELKNINYRDTVGTMNVNMSVLPAKFADNFHVNLSPSAITNLSCIHEKPQRGERRRWTKKRKNKKPNDNAPDDAKRGSSSPRKKTGTNQRADTRTNE